MKKVLITGGAGFIGSHMVDLLLSKNYSVRVIDNLITGKLENLANHANNKNLIVDERDIRTLTPGDNLFKDIDYICFCGIGDIVPSIDKPNEYLSVNTQGTVNICEGKVQFNKEISLRGIFFLFDIAKVPTDEMLKLSQNIHMH